MDVNTVKSKRAFRGGIPKFLRVEEQLFSYIQGKRQQAFAISIEMAQLKVTQIASELQIPNFKASRGWVSRFMDRHQLSIRRTSFVNVYRIPTTKNYWLSNDTLFGYKKETF